MTGEIKALKSNGFGFIATELGIDFFFHMSEYKDKDGNEGDWKVLLQRFVVATEAEQKIKVNFENDIDAPAGPRALKVRLIEDDTNQMA